MQMLLSELLRDARIGLLLFFALLLSELVGVWPPAHTASATRDNCPANYQALIRETMWAANIHKDWLDNKRDNNPDWHTFWERSHRETAEALLLATKGCPNA